MRETLIAVYLDWRNNYLTIAKYAEANGLNCAQGDALINLARSVYQSEHPDA